MGQQELNKTCEKGIHKIKKILNNYNKDDYKLFNDTINTLIQKGVPNGAYQDYGMVADIIQILAIIADEILQQA